MPNQEPDRAEFTARYFIESAVPIEQAAEIIAGEQSSGTFMSLPGETDALKSRSRARVTRIDTLPPVLEPSLRSAFVERRAHKGVFHRAEIEIAFPIANVGANLPTLLATVAGNLFELGEITGLRLLDLGMPPAYARQFPGPKFGIEGTRQKAGDPRPAVDRHHHQAEHRAVGRADRRDGRCLVCGRHRLHQG